MTDNVEQQEKQQQFAKHFSQSLTTKIAMIIIRLVRNAILARVLGPADRGLFSLISSLPELIMTAGNAGLSNAAAYHQANGVAPLKTIMGNINILIIGISICLIFISIHLVNQDWLVKDYSSAIEPFAYFIAFAIPLMLIKVINTNLLNVMHRVGQVNSINLLESSIPLILFLLLWGAFDIDALLAATWSWFLSLAVLGLLTIYQLKQGFPLNFDSPLQKSLLSYGSRGHFDTLFQKLLLRVDFLFVGSMIGSEALGYYAMATAAAELLLAFPQALAVPLFSFLMKNAGQDKQQITSKVLRILIITMILGATFFALTGEFLIHLLFGEDFLPAYGPLLYLLPGIVFLSYCSLVRLSLLGQNMPGTVSIISGIAVTINVVLNLTFIPSLGVEGVALASTLAYCFAAIGLYHVQHKATGLEARETLVIRREDIKLLINTLKRKF